MPPGRLPSAALVLNSSVSMASPIASPKTCRTIVSKFEDCDISRVKGVTLPSLCGVKRIALSKIHRAGRNRRTLGDKRPYIGRGGDIGRNDC
jgi:hypothetical protein